MKELYDLTNPQKSIWVTEEFYKGTSIENIAGTAMLSQEVNFDKLKEAINIFVKTNDSFRLKFIKDNGNIKQFIDDFSPFSFETINVSTNQDIKKVEEELSKKPLQIINSYLFNIKFFKFEDGHGGFVIVMHHLIVDAWAAGLVISRIIDIYDALLSNTFVLENFSNPSYTEYISSEQKYLQSNKFEKDKAFWNDLFKTITETATFPSFTQNKELSSKAKRKTFKIPRETMDFVNSFCKENKISPFNFFMGVYSIYLSRVSNLDEFVIGTPILNRSNVKEKHTVGMFISVVPFKVTLNHENSFADFVSNISADFFNIFRHQKYPYQTLLEDLRKQNSSTPNLYNVMYSYQNMRSNKQSTKTDYESKWLFNGNISDDMEIHFFDINDTGVINVAYDYKISKYSSEDIYAMHSRVLHIINQVIEKNNILLKNIEIVTPDEKNIILNKFNNTKMDYPKNKTIVQLFEEQVEKTPDNIAVVFENEKLTYRELNEKANSLALYLKNNGLKTNDIVGLFLDKSLESIVSILATLKCGATFMPIDINYPEKRISFMLSDANCKIVLTSCNLTNKLNFLNIGTKLLNIDLSNENIYSVTCSNINASSTPDTSVYIMYTSGSTGNPKGVLVTNKNIVRLVKNTNYIKFEKNERILQTGSIVFDACTFEIWGALLNGFELYIIKKQDLLDPALLEQYLHKNKITILWLTAPLFNQLCENNPNMFDSVRVLLTGGDVLSPRHINMVRKACPNLTIINGYGPTENTTFSTCFTIDKTYEDSIPIGFPIANSTCYVVSPNLNLLPVGISGELLVGGDGVSNGYLNNPEFTAEKFIPNPFGEGMLYKTGDLVKWRTDGSIVFLGRVDNQVKIRGFRVELNEITLKIQEFTGIRECITVAKNINGEKTICSYFSSNEKININELKETLRNSLPHYAIPTYFIELESLPINVNGKVDAKKLPEPKVLNTKTEIIPARNEIDSKLIDLLKVLLNINSISIDDSFFELGGDSLSAINFCSQIQSEFNVQLFVKDILEHPNVQEISDIISKNLNIEKLNTIVPVEKQDFYPVSSAQKRMYFASTMAGESVLYNIPGGIIIDGEINVKKLEKCFNTLISRHEALRTYFTLENNNVVQKIAEKTNFKLEIQENADFNDLNLIFKDFVKSFDLNSAPLFRAKFIKFSNEKSALFVDMHHIISDGTSLAIFTQELCKLYNDENLPKLNITYKDFAVFENNNLSSGNMQKAEKYWISQFEENIPILNLPTNYPRPAVQSFEGAKIYSSIDVETKQKIDDLAKNLGVTPYMVLLSAYYILLSKYTAQEDIVVGSPIVGRDISETYNLIGMFVNSLALRTKIDNNLSFKEFLDVVKINCLNAYKYQTYPFDALVDNLNIKRDTSRNPLFDTMFIYQNNGLTNIHFNNVYAKYYMPDTNISKFDLSIELIPNDDGISVSFEYATKLFNENFIKNLSKHYLNILNAVLENTKIKISDIDMLSEEEINNILYNFNNTDADYPKEKTIVQLFEEQVEETPDNIAVVFENEKLTYKELNEKANSLAHYLRNNGIGRNDVVALRIDKSIEMVSSILGIIKSGACYLPINLSYPKDRVNFMLKDSNAKYLLCNKNSSKDIVETDICKILIDFENQEIYSQSTNNLPLVNIPEDLIYIIYTSGSTGTPKGAMLMHKNVVRLMKNDKFLFDFNSNDVWTMFHSVAFDFSVWEMYGALLYGGKLIIVPDYTAKDPNLFLELMEKEEVTVLNQTPTYFYNLLNCEIKKIHPKLAIRYIIFGGEALKPTLISQWRTLHPKTKLINMYGITETTVHVTFKELSDTDLKQSASNIGVPIPTLKVLLLDKNLRLVPQGVPGEICVSGDGVFKGYLNRTDLNKTKLTTNPYNKNEILYRSADSAILNFDNTLEYIGRIDTQVKIRGFRVELGEIEEKISTFPNIKSCVVTTKNFNNSHDLLCAYYISDETIDISKLRNHLQRTLPNYMIPQYFLEVQQWPYNHNGKVDVKNLPAPTIDVHNQNIILPRNEIDSKLIDLLKMLLNINNISIDDNFFELGGDSLSAINLCAQIQNEFNVQLFVKDILENPIIQDISDMISNNLNTNNRLSITPAEKQDSYPASSAQKRMYFVSNMAGENSILYNIPGSIILDGSVDTNKLEKCFNELIKRHEALRTYFDFENDNVVQKIAKEIDFKLDIEENADFNNLDSIFKGFVKSFDLTEAPLFRAKFIKFTNKKSALFVDMHHIISDGTSLSIFTHELCKLYNDEKLPALNITYKDFAVFENSMLTSGSLEEAENYWVNQFADEPPILNLPTNYSRPATQSFEGAKVYSSIDLETTNKINSVSKSLGVTPYMLLLSAYYILLEKYTFQDDIVVGSPIVGRDIAETYNLIGMFVNTLALRAKIDSKLSFKEFLETVKTNCLNAYKYQTYPFDELINKLNIKRDASRNPLFDTMFTYQNNGLTDIHFNNVVSKYYIPETAISKFDLSLELIPNENGIEVSFEYVTKLFDEDFIKNLSCHYLNILSTILENNEIKISDICMLSEREKNTILNDFNNKKVDYPKDLTVVELFEKQVEQNSEQIAVVFEGEKLTYRELNEKANSLAHYLKQNNIGKNDIVPVFMNRSVDLIIAMLGIIKAGAAYLPIAVETPAERFDFILQNSRSKIVFVKSSQNLIYNETIKIVDIEQFDYSKYSTKNINVEIKPLDLLYVIYTSGSTGNPKGVKVCHHNLVNFVKSFNELYSGISYEDRLLASTNISFDVSIFEFFMTLLNGAKLYLYNEPNINDIFKYCKTIIKEKITFLYIPPNILEDVYSILSSYANIPINKILLGVEPIKASTIKKYYTLNPNLKIINAYGPTETTICATGVCLNNDILKKYKTIPIGRPLHNLQIFILDKNNSPVPIGIPGEIYISGDNVAKGYLNNKELTDKNFVSLPNLNCKLAYKTGDLAKWNSDGLISFIGRNDYQVKINGHRIELGEIESCIYLYPNIDKALVLLDKNNKLICYFSSSKQININDLKAFMKRKLPLYFIPNFFVQVEKFKLTANGKIDRKALAKIKVDSSSSYEEPTTPYQKSLAEAFQTVLGIDKVGITDNFFELGGDSLLAIKLQIEAFNKSLDLSYKDIFKYPTIKQLSENVSSAKSTDFNDEYDYSEINKLLKNNTFNQKIKLSKNKFKNILLTGSTGYLGSHILDALLKNTKCNIYCLIRAKDNNDPQIRLLNTLRFYFGNKYDRLIFNRIIVIEGDIKDEKLGLNDLYYEELGSTIDLVINSAAIVKHYGSLDTFNATNIQGAKNIIRFCSSFKCKLYHLSTLSVSGNIFETDSYKVADLSSETNFNEQSLYIEQDLSNVYIYTKFIAERLILENVLNGSLDAKIIRLGNITNRYSDGIFQINVSENAFLNRINSFLHIGCIPDYLVDKYTEFSPVDLCAEAIIKLVFCNNNFTIFHVYNNNHITFRELFSILNSLKIKMDIVDKETFNKKINYLSKDDKSKKILSGIINDFDENKNLVYNTNIKIQNNFTNKLLKNLSFKWPKINEKYLKKYIIYLKSIGYIK